MYRWRELPLDRRASLPRTSRWSEIISDACPVSLYRTSGPSISPAPFFPRYEAVRRPRIPPHQQEEMVEAPVVEVARPPAPPQKLSFRLGMVLLRRLAPLFSRQSLIPLDPVLPADSFDWIAELDVNWEVIAGEAQQVLGLCLPSLHQIAEDQRTIDLDENWKAFFLYGFGIRDANNCARCPETAALVSRVPGLVTAFFSILGPGKHIPAHRGAYRGIIRYHLGLIIPRESYKCRMRIGEEVYCWREGESIVFDDTYEHEVWNETDEVRVVLFIDVVRPLRFPASALNRTLIAAARHSPVVRRARRRQMEWDYHDRPPIAAGSS
jgi:ornithine lipid ester-linked acyl 2-hydroxylase